MIETDDELETVLRELEVRVEDLNEYVDNENNSPVLSDSETVDGFLDHLEEKVGDAREKVAESVEESDEDTDVTDDAAGSDDSDDE